METELNLRRMCRHCGALLKDAGRECWHCHRALNYDDIVRVERRAPRSETGALQTNNGQRAFITIGTSTNQRLLFVAHADIDEDRVQMISARATTRHETHAYQKRDPKRQ